MEKDYAKYVVKNEGKFDGWIIKGAYEKLGIEHDSDRFAI